VAWSRGRRRRLVASRAAVEAQAEEQANMQLLPSAEGAVADAGLLLRLNSVHKHVVTTLQDATALAYASQVTRQAQAYFRQPEQMQEALFSAALLLAPHAANNARNMAGQPTTSAGVSRGTHGRRVIVNREPGRGLPTHRGQAAANNGHKHRSVRPKSARLSRPPVSLEPRRPSSARRAPKASKQSPRSGGRGRRVVQRNGTRMQTGLLQKPILGR
jgi:hypothetical protein